MPTPDTTRPQDSLVGLAFPVVRVRFAGQTDHQPSRYIATLRGVRHVGNYDHALDAPRNAYNTAAACWAKYRASLGHDAPADDEHRVFIPGDLSEDSYSYTVVPVAFLSPDPDADADARRGAAIIAP